MRTNKSGFSLIEILVVVVILGITASFALMTFGDFGTSHQIEAEAERFAHQLEKVRYHAILEAIPYRIKISPPTYHIFRFEPPNRWLLQKHGKLSLTSPQKYNIMIQASGEITPFSILFGLPNTKPLAEVHTKLDQIKYQKL